MSRSAYYNNKQVVITGAASGIGKELTTRLHAQGAKCLAVDIDENGLTELAQNLPGLKTFSADLSNPSDREKLHQHLNGVDIYFANAGIALYGHFHSLPVNDIRKITEINWLAPIETLLHLNANNSKSFQYVITASAMSFVGMPNYALYSGLKAALHGFADTLSFEKHPKFRLSLVYPVATRTSFFTHKQSGQKVPWPSQKPEDVAEQIIQGVARGKREIFPSSTFFALNLFYFIHRNLFALYRHYYKS